MGGRSAFVCRRFERWHSLAPILLCHEFSLHTDAQDSDAICGRSSAVCVCVCLMDDSAVCSSDV